MKQIIAFGLFASALAGPSFAQDQDIFLARFPGAEVIFEDASPYDEVVFPSAELASRFELGETATFEGEVQAAIHVAPEGRSTLEVYRAYQNAALAAGYQEVFACRGDACGGSMMYVLVQDRDWMARHVAYGEEAYSLFERKIDGQNQVLALFALDPDTANPAVANTRVLLQQVSTEAEEEEAIFLEPLTSGEIATEIESTGSAAIYGLQFAFNSADLLPASGAVIQEIATFLEANPTLSVHLVGHTDSEGALDYNMDLSLRRAEAVRNALTGQFGISVERLQANGVGYLAPIATNATENGRAQNRRVEVIPF